MNRPLRLLLLLLLLPATAYGQEALLLGFRVAETAREALPGVVGRDSLRVAGYRTLQAVLVQQKLWALSNRRQQVLPKFRPIAGTAEKLHRIFAGYAAVMDTLRKLDELTEATAPAPATEGEAEPSAAPTEAPPGPSHRRTDAHGW